MNIFFFSEYISYQIHLEGRPAKYVSYSEKKEQRNMKDAKLFYFILFTTFHKLNLNIN